MFFGMSILSSSRNLVPFLLEGFVPVVEASFGVVFFRNMLLLETKVTIELCNFDYLVCDVS